MDLTIHLESFEKQTAYITWNDGRNVIQKAELQLEINDNSKKPRGMLLTINGIAIKVRARDIA